VPLLATPPPEHANPFVIASSDNVSVPWLLTSPPLKPPDELSVPPVIVTPVIDTTGVAPPEGATISNTRLAPGALRSAGTGSAIVVLAAPAPTIVML
jgi:hypothetical protein